MEIFDYTPVENGHAASLLLGLFERGYLPSSQIQFFGGGRECPVGGLNLPRMNKRLAVESVVSSLLAFAGKAFGVSESVVDTVDAYKTMGFRSQQSDSQASRERRPVRMKAAAEVLRQIVRSKNETGKST